eukprot:2104123-Rhodomonas_salina.2
MRSTTGSVQSVRGVRLRAFDFAAACPYAPAMPCPVLTPRMVLPGCVPGAGSHSKRVASPLGSYAFAMRCPVLT